MTILPFRQEPWDVPIPVIDSRDEPARNNENTVRDYEKSVAARDYRPNVNEISSPTPVQIDQLEQKKWDSFGQLAADERAIGPAGLARVIKIKK